MYAGNLMPTGGGHVTKHTSAVSHSNVDTPTQTHSWLTGTDTFYRMKSCGISSELN